MNILVTLDRNYLPPLRVMLGSLLRNDPRETFDIYTIGDGLRPEDYTGARAHDEVFPWDFFDSRVKKSYLAGERDKAFEEKVTRDCRLGCHGCGASARGECEIAGHPRKSVEKSLC